MTLRPNNRTPVSAFYQDRQGSPAVEFAIIAPLVLATVFATFEFGRALYETNKLNAAASAGARSIAINGTSDDAAIIASIEQELDQFDPDKLTIKLDTKTIADESFKEITVSYSHDYIIKLGARFSSVTLNSTRYVPAINNGSDMKNPDQHR